MTHSAYEDDPAIPTLTRRVTDTSDAPPHPQAASINTAPATDPLSSTVLQTLLQVEIERLVSRAIDEAMDHVRLRVEREIPTLVKRTLERVHGKT